MSPSFERFWSLVTAGGRAESSNPPMPSPIDQRAFALAEWASREDCQKTFMPYLETLIADADETLAPRVLDSHAAGAYAIGYRDALLAMYRQFETWAGNRHS